MLNKQFYVESKYSENKSLVKITTFNGSVYTITNLKFFPQCAVRAAVEGRVLILEGIEKAERNVLPVLNNLLENREMQLDDGRFLMAADRYDKLLEVWDLNGCITI